MKARILKSAMILISILALLPIVIVAGSTGKIKGVVTEKDTGNPIAGVNVTLEGTRLGGTTDANGEFTIFKIPPGKYTVVFSSPSFRTVEIKSVPVMENQTTEQNVKMEKAVSEINLNSGKVATGLELQEQFNEPDRDGITKDEIMTGILNSPTMQSQIMTEKKSGGEREMIVRQKRGPQMHRPVPPYPGGHSPAHGGTAIVNGKPFDAMFFKDYGTNPFVDTEDDHLSTFAIDVDDASFIMTRSYLERGELPPDEAIRTEEFINHFEYDYSSPRRDPFAVHIEGGPSIFGQNSAMLQIGIKGREIRPEHRKPANLVFVIDISGSMAREDRLTLVKRALRILVDNLESSDRVGIVVYGSRGRVVLEPTSVRNRERILSAIEWLHTDGATNAEAGIRLGYEMAYRNFDRNKINRIILCSDGVANVGTTGPEEILKQIKRYAEMGITLTTVGFGMGNFNDVLMEKLGDKGNGHYAYVDDIAEARRIFMDNLTGTLQVIARDVKIQVDFDPKVVRSYRLIGYENRDVADDKFRDDKEDGGEIGSGHQVTALYEIKLHQGKSMRNLGKVFIRYKDPDSDEVDEISVPIKRSELARNFRKCSTDFKLAAAAAEFGEILGKSYWAKDSNLGSVLNLVQEIYEENDSPEIVEFMNLIIKARMLQEPLAERPDKYWRD